MTPILLLEINEVPWRLIDRYRDDPSLPNLREFFDRSTQFTSVAVDSGELSPWVTWPTLHRGISNERHRVRDLGQDPSTFLGTTIWEDLRAAGHSIGVCGSLQSWPPIDPGPEGFYIPDTFAQDARCIPDHVSPLQAFNLAQVRRNGRIVSRGLPPPGELLEILGSLRRSGVSARTIARIASGLIRERADRRLVARRPVYQTLLFWDVFKHHFDPLRPPAISTFFTNHVAGVMHRFWHDVFPEDFQARQVEPAATQEPLMRFALGVLDDMLRTAMSWCRTNPALAVVFASSMGQGAVHRESHQGAQLLVRDFDLLMRVSGARAGEYDRRMAMAPQVAVGIADDGRRREIRHDLESISTESGSRFVRVSEIGDNLSVTIGTPLLGELRDAPLRIRGRQVSLAEAGLALQDVEAGTGYHVPQGVLSVLNPDGGAPLNDARAEVPADAIKGWLMAIAREGRPGIDAMGAATRSADLRVGAEALCA